MKEGKKESELYELFEKERNLILLRLNSFFSKVPKEAVRVNLIIKRSSCGPADFFIHGGLNGPQLYHLNSEVKDWTLIGNFELEKSDSWTSSVKGAFSLELVTKVFITWFDDQVEHLEVEHFDIAVAIYEEG